MSPPDGSDSQHTVGHLGRYLSRAVFDEPRPPAWPPDAFAIVAMILSKSGAYRQVVKDWPPAGSRPGLSWCDAISEIGRDWRMAFIRDEAAPTEVARWWQIVRTRSAVRLTDVESDRELCEALLQLSAAADEASKGIGVPTGHAADAYDLAAAGRLRSDSTLCHRVDADLVRVLPKLHTPQSGITFRSLTHHLGAVETDEIRVVWSPGLAGPSRGSINLLLAPFPREVLPSHFTMATPKTGDVRNMPEPYGFFDYAPPAHDKIAANVLSLVSRAQRLVGHIDGLVFPELALRASDEQDIRAALEAKRMFLVCGVGEPCSGAAPGKNYVVFNLPIASWTQRFVQTKHHRWILDQRQVVQYGLGGTLHAGCSWWEHSELAERKLHFVAMKPWLTMCVLICEDLARPDPAAEIIRTVGPNLVIGILMDGPQLKSRWPARYASVLADDPGSSVLTLTSEGMARLSRPGHTMSGAAPVVALWKDAKSGSPSEIELPNGAEALVLCLSVEYHEEWTADGRSDHAAAAYPVLVGVHPVWRE